MAGRERRHLVEKEQRGVTVAPDVVMALLELQHAANPLPRGPAARARESGRRDESARRDCRKADRARASRSVRRTGRRDSAAASRRATRAHHGRFRACGDSSAGRRAHRLRGGRRIGRREGFPQALFQLAFELLLGVFPPAFRGMRASCCPSEMGRRPVERQSGRRGFGAGGSLPDGWVAAGGSEAGKLSSSSSSQQLFFACPRLALRRHARPVGVAAAACVALPVHDRSPG